MRSARLTGADIGVQFNQGGRQYIVSADDEVGLIVCELGERVVFRGIGFGADGGGHGYLIAIREHSARIRAVSARLGVTHAAALTWRVDAEEGMA